MFRSLTPVVRAILLSNVIVFGLQSLVGESALDAFALWPLRTSPYFPGMPFQPWQLITYAFLHGGWWHLFANMLALYMFGPDIERILGPRRFLGYYLTCVVGAAVTQMLVIYYFTPTPYPTIGASGGIFGILLAFGMTYPKRRVMLLFPPIPMPAWLFVTLYGVMELGMGVMGTQQGVAHFAHLGGMAAGFLLLRHWTGRRPRQQYF